MNEPRFTLYSVADIMEYKHESTVIIKKGEITFKEYPSYAIDVKRIKTKSDILEWVYHLSEKNWATNDMIHDFIEELYAYINIKIYK